MTAAIILQPPSDDDNGSAELERRILAYAVNCTIEGRSLHAADAASHYGAPLRRVRDAIARLEERGALVRMIGMGGWVSPADANRSLTRQTLEDLLALAREHTDAAHEAPRGRKALDANREIRTLTQSQFADIERVVTLVATRTLGAQGSPRNISGALLQWNTSARGGQGEWALAEVVRRITREQHREKHVARKPETPWRPDMAEESVTKNVGAVQNLMFLAATHGLVDRVTRAAPAGAYLYFPAWVPTLERWIRWMTHRDGAGNPPRVSVGARVLATYATRIGFGTPRETDWLAVRDLIIADAEAGALPNHKAIAARWVWRSVVERLGPRLRLSAAYEWPLDSKDAISLVGSRAVEAAAVADVGPAQRNFSGWLLPDGRFAAGLVEGPYGLRRWAAWSTLDDLKLRVHAPPLPRRAWHWESAFGTRRKGAAPRQVASETLKVRLHMFAYLAGYAARLQGVDWSHPDAPGLLLFAEPNFIEGFVQWVLSLPEDVRGNRYTQLSQRVRTIAWLINGFLASQAELENDEERLSALRQSYNAIESLAAEIPMPRHLDRREVAAKVLATAEGWKGGDGVDGIRKIERLICCLESELTRQARGRTVDEQIADIRAGTFAPGPSWGKTLRLMVVLIIAERLPFRGGTLAQLELCDWRNLPVGPTQQALASRDQLPLWEGQLGLDVPGYKMKSKRAFPGRLIQAEFVRTTEQQGDATRERRLRRDLLELWFMAGGGRDICRTRTDARTGDRVIEEVSWLFPDSVGDDDGQKRARPMSRGHAAKGRRINAKPGQWRRTRLSAAFARAVRKHAGALQINLKALKVISGALGYHTVRRLFGSYWARVNLLLCSRLLDHTNVKLTAEIYCGQDVRSMTLDLGGE
jgi:hypothetical protein